VRCLRLNPWAISIAAIHAGILCGEAAGTARAADERLAVLEFQGSKVDNDTLRTFTDAVRGGALEGLVGRSTNVMTRENTMALLKAMGKSDCTEGECEVETARNIGADYVVSGSVTRIEDHYVVALKVHESKGGTLLAADMVKGKTQVQVLDQLREHGRDLLRATFGRPESSLGSSGREPRIGAPSEYSVGEAVGNDRLLPPSTRPMAPVVTTSPSPLAQGEAMPPPPAYWEPQTYAPTVAAASPTPQVMDNPTVRQGSPEEQEYNPAGYHLHDGFYLRILLGWGNHVVTSPDGRNSKGAPEVGIALGWALSDSLIAFVEAQNLLGPGLSYYFNPSNWYLSAQIGEAMLSTSYPTSDGTQSTTAWIPGGSMTLGKEWWASENWGVGVAIRVEGGSGTSGGNDYSFSMGELLLSSTFN
jgi:TolB-like protein